MLQLVMKKKISEKAKVQSNRGIIILYSEHTHQKKKTITQEYCNVDYRGGGVIEK